MNDRNRDDRPDTASWTHDEKQRAMRAAEAHEQSVMFWRTLKRVMAIITSVLTFWILLKQWAGQSWSDLVALFGGRLPK